MGAVLKEIFLGEKRNEMLPESSGPVSLNTKVIHIHPEVSGKVSFGSDDFGSISFWRKSV